MISVGRTVLALFTACSLIWSGTGGIAEGKVITDIKPTHSVKGVKHIQLKKVAELSVDGEYKDFFLVKPVAFAAGPKGEFFIYDWAIPVIFHLNRELKLVCKIGRGGFGPGEMSPRDSSMNKLYISADNRLMVCDNRNQKILSFDFSGKLLHEYPINLSLRMKSFKPVIDGQGHFYTISSGGGGADRWDENGKWLKTYLDNSAYTDFLLFEPPDKITKKGYQVEMTWNQSKSANTSYELFENNQLAILIANSVTLYVFKDDDLILKKNIWIEEELPIFKKSVAEVKQMNEAAAGRSSSFFSMFREIIRDNDDNRTFYLSGAVSEQKQASVYHFDLQGRLMAVYYTKEPFFLKCKRNNRFYGYNSGCVSIYEADNTPGRKKS